MDHRNQQSILVLFLTFITQTVLAIPFNQMQVKIDEAIEQLSPNANIGIMVESIADQKIIYQKNPYQLFVPASVVKILPAVSALSFLGPNYTFQTKILAKKPDIRNGVVNHDLYLYFDGDPSLTQKNLKNLVKQLSALGIKKITGNIHIDDTAFDREHLGAGWMREDLNLCYASPISAIIIDKNCIPVKLAPAKKAGQLAILTNPQKHISITNHVITKNINKNKKRQK